MDTPRVRVRLDGLQAGRAVAARIFGHVPAKQARPILLLGIGLFLFTGLSEAFGLIAWDKAIRTWSYGLGAAMATTALAAQALAPPRWLTFLGVMIALAAVAGCCCYILVERPRLKRLSMRRRLVPASTSGP